MLIDTEKVSIEEEKVLITSRNLSMQTAIDSLKAMKRTKENARKLFAYMEFDGMFGRTDIMEITGLSITAAGNLLTNLKSAELIAPVSGYGNGKYKFVIPKE
ncbi:MAG: hypothetical protein LUD44_06930 [Firmicutes bacterium]|nr:hypothetical protein [Bacillota bacterium]